MTKVKICGITNLRDALLAVEFGADALGFNFHRGSPRYIEPMAAGEICRQLPGRVLKVGVFVNEPIDSITNISGVAKLDAIQLHGDETEDFVRAIAERTGLQTIKAFRVTHRFELEVLQRYAPDAFLLDSWSATERGGTGEKFDWIAATLARQMVRKLYLAGGLNPENVAEAIDTVGPYAVDACSGLESSKGIKDREKMRLFIERAKLQ
jgi:phosphoribosylanthranilate isomerase